MGEQNFFVGDEVIFNSNIEWIKKKYGDRRYTIVGKRHDECETLYLLDVEKSRKPSIWYSGKYLSIFETKTKFNIENGK